MDQAENLRRKVKNHRETRRTAKVFTVTSGKGGVGKSSISVNLAIALKRRGKKVVIIDGDFGLANIEVMLGIRPRYNLADLMFRGKDLKDIITEGPEGIGFISGGSGIQELTNLSKDQIIYLIHKLVELDKLADVIIVDTGAGITDNVMEFLVASNEVFLVATPEPTSITDSYALLKTLNRKKDNSMDNIVIKMISNQVSSYEEGEELHEKLSIVVGKFLNVDLKFLYTIPKDNNVSKAVIHQEAAISLYPNTPFVKAINRLADQLYEDDSPKSEEKQGIAQLFAQMLRARIKRS